jgi:hypothetical protein
MVLQFPAVGLPESLTRIAFASGHPTTFDGLAVTTSSMVDSWVFKEVVGQLIAQVQIEARTSRSSSS